MGKQRKKKRLALLLLVTTLISTVFGCWHGGNKFNVQAVSDRETLNYFAEGFGTGADFSKDSWEMKTAFTEGASSSITENPNNQAGIVENEHSGKQEKIIRLINARSLDLNSASADAWNRVSTAIVGDQVSLKESSEFSAKFTISMPDACTNEHIVGGSEWVHESGGDGIAFIITPASTIKGSIGTGMGYYGIMDSLAIELDPCFNGAYGSFASSTAPYVNWGYDNQVFANTNYGYLQAVADDTRNKGLEYDWDYNYWTYLRNQGYAELPASRDRRFDHVGVMLDGETREHCGISYLNGLQPDKVEYGKYVNVQDSSASTPSTSSECATRFTDEGDIDVIGEEVDNRLFTVWVEYDGENLFVRYANGNFSEAVRPENPQIALEGRSYLAQKFANEDVSIGFVSSISSNTGSAASHTVHSVAFANTYIENGITAEYIHNTKLTAAKEVVQGVLDGITVDNDTTKKDIQDTLDEALDQAGIADVTVTVGDLTKTEPTTSAEGRIEAVISFECGTVRDSITMNKVIEKLPAPTPTAAPTSTPVLPTEEPTAAPTATPVPPTAEPTSTPVSPTTTPVLPTAAPTDTPVPPTAEPTSTPVSPITTPTVVPAVTPSPVPAIVPKKEQEKYELSLNARLKVSQAGKNINVSWGKIAEADGYDVYVQYCGKKYTEGSITAVKSGKTTQITLKKVNGKTLDLKKNYKIYVLAYKLADGRKVTLAKTITAHIVGKNNKTYTNAKAVKVKKNFYTLRKGKTAKISASTVLVEKGKKQLTDAHAKEFRYASTDKKVAKVSAKGKIKAVGKGKCTIYVYARNGYAKKVKVTVK